MTSVPAPTIEYGQLAPMLIVFGAAIAGVLVEAFVPRPSRRGLHLFLTLGALVVGFAITVKLAVDQTRNAAAMGAVGVDGPTLFIQGTILLLAFVSVLLIMDHEHFVAQAASVPGSAEEQQSLTEGSAQTEVFPLVLFAVGGMLLFPAANDLLIMFVALEVLSLPLYLLCGLARRRRLLSQEAAVKYFLLGAFSSAFFLYGTALVYGFAGTVNFGTIGGKPGIVELLPTIAGREPLILVGMGMIGVGLLFKIGAAPFQAWKPDVYQGAPTPITALMASCTVVAAFGALLRVFWVPLGNEDWTWSPVLWGVAILTMIVGTVLAITQTDIKRMLAYSSIAHAGFILIGVIATGDARQNSLSMSAVLFYLLVYGFATVGAFAIVTMVRDAGGEAGHLSRWAGLGKRSPLLAGVFALFLLAMAGIPLTSGFFGKYAVFQAAFAGGVWPLVIVAVVASAAAAFFYVRVIVLMFFSEPAPDGPTVELPGIATSMVVSLAAAATVVLGVVPQYVLDFANEAAAKLFVR